MKRAGNECLLSSKTKKLDSSEEFINYVSDPPSLKTIALVAVAVKLWGCSGREECATNYDSGSEEDYPNIEEGALKTLEAIFLPDSLKHQVSNIIRPIGLQWVGWVNYADGEEFAQYCNLNELYKERGSSYWKMEGIVDVAKLVKDIANKAIEHSNKKVDFTTLYESACTYCLEEYIPDLWLKVSKKRSAKYYARKKNYHRHIIAYWTASLNNELPNLKNRLVQNDTDVYDINLGICENMVSSFIVSGNVIALKYFWNNKLTEQEKNSNIGNWISLVIKTLKKEFFDSYNETFDLRHGENFNQNDEFFSVFPGFDSDDENFAYDDYNSLTDIMCFLLSQLNSHFEQKDIFQTHAKVILLSLFGHWPLRRFFLPTITVMLDSLQENIYVGMMLKMVHLKIKKSTEVLLSEVWDISPLNLKKAFLRFLTHRANTIAQLLSIGDYVTILMILSNATAEEKKLILFRLLDESEFEDFVDSNRFSILAIDCLASKTLLSDCDLHSFKENFMSRHATDLSTVYIFTQQFSELDELWKWASQSLQETRKSKQNYIDLRHVYQSLIAFDNYEHVNDFLNWYFETEKEVSKFKKSFVHEDNLEDCKCLMRSWSCEGKDGWELFEKFQNYSFDSSDEITQAKKVFAEFIKQDKSFTGSNEEFNALFESWCRSSSDKVK